MATATGVYNTTYRRDFALRHTKAEYVRLALLAAFAVILPFSLDQYWLSYVNLILLAAIAAVGLNILTGYTGPGEPGHRRLPRRRRLHHGQPHLPGPLADARSA